MLWKQAKTDDFTDKQNHARLPSFAIMRMEVKHFGQVLLLICLIPATPYTQSVFHLNSNNGLCTSSQTDLTCDHLGNMWMGSYTGLMKYSGTQLKCFDKIGNGPYDISAPEMHSITEDDCGFIWVATTAGIDKIDPVTYRVEHYPIRSPFPESTFVGYIYSVYADRYDFIWFSTDIALFRLDSHTGHYEAIPTSKDGNGIPWYTIMYNGYTETKDGLWIHTGAGMVFYEYASHQFFHAYNNPKHLPVFQFYSKPFDKQSDVRMDSQGKLWYVKNHHTLMSYDIRQVKLDSFDFSKPEGTWNCCYSIGIDPHDKIWIGFRHGGLAIFDQETKSFTSIRAAGPNKWLQSDYIHAIEPGPDGKMFVSNDIGLDIIDLYHNPLREYSISDALPFTNLKYEAGEVSTDLDGKSIFIPFYRVGYFNSLIPQKHLHTMWYRILKRGLHHIYMWIPQVTISQ